jgi:hypothetical protein
MPGRGCSRVDYRAAGHSRLWPASPWLGLPPERRSATQRQVPVLGVPILDFPAAQENAAPHMSVGLAHRFAVSVSGEMRSAATPESAAAATASSELDASRTSVMHLRTTEKQNATATGAIRRSTARRVSTVVGRPCLPKRGRTLGEAHQRAFPVVGGPAQPTPDRVQPAAG